jgi:hypothetical protein
MEPSIISVIDDMLRKENVVLGQSTYDPPSAPSVMLLMAMISEFSSAKSEYPMIPGEFGQFEGPMSCCAATVVRMRATAIRRRCHTNMIHGVFSLESFLFNVTMLVMFPTSTR